MPLLLHCHQENLFLWQRDEAARAFSKEVCELLGIDQKELQVILDKRFAEIQNSIVNANSVQQIKMSLKETKTLGEAKKLDANPPVEEV